MLRIWAATLLDYLPCDPGEKKIGLALAVRISRLILDCSPTNPLDLPDSWILMAGVVPFVPVPQLQRPHLRKMKSSLLRSSTCLELELSEVARRGNFTWVVRNIILATGVHSTRSPNSYCR